MSANGCTHHNGTQRQLRFEEWWLDQDGDGNAPSVLQCASQWEVWGNYELDGDMVHGWQMDDTKCDWRKPDFKAKVDGGGISGDNVWIKCWESTSAWLSLTAMPIAIGGIKSKKM